MYNRSSNKRPRSPPQVAGNTRFKGVVPQTSGHWGAQIYANRQRIWLGTFKSEKEAAMAYDTAAIKLRSGDSYRNFALSPVTMQEPFFQKFYSTESVLNMIKDGSYATKFSEFLNQNNRDEESSDKYENVAAVGSCFFMENDNLMMKVNGMEKFSCRKLFRKELTPSDVGKLNRLVIPKKFAVKYFPEINSAENNNNNNDSTSGDDEEVLLSFRDALGRLWKFRYCYWKSSQSFVFTRGWNKFVKEKDLKDKDVITFFHCEGDPKALKNTTSSSNGRDGNDRMKVSSTFYLIDVCYRRSKNEDVIGHDEGDDSKGTLESEVAEEEKKTPSLIRLFGVDIQQ